MTRRGTKSRSRGRGRKKPVLVLCPKTARAMKSDPQLASAIQDLQEVAGRLVDLCSATHYSLGYKRRVTCQRPLDHVGMHAAEFGGGGRCEWQEDEDL